MINSKLQKTSITRAVALAISTMVSSVGVADPISQLEIKDVGSNTDNAVNTFSSVLDGRSGAFKFNANPINIKSYAGTSLFTGDVAAGTLLAVGAANPTGSYSTGFLFSGAPFIPYTFGAGFVGDVTVDNAGNPRLDISALDFGGVFSEIDFNLPPDNISPIRANFVEPGPNSGEFLVNFLWGHDITTAEDPSLQFSAFTAQWVLEGVLSVTDSKPRLFIRDSGGTPSVDSVAVNTDVLSGVYADFGAVCQDVVDGNISASITTTPDPLPTTTGSPGASFSITYGCQDSQGNIADSVTRTVNVLTGSDAEPPVIALSSPAVSVAGRVDPDPATVNILQGKPYIDEVPACSDNVDGNIDVNIISSGSVNTAIPGDYSITYNCSDAAGNAATQQTRTVSVIADTLAPEITLAGNNPLRIATGSPFNDPGATCADTNPVDAGAEPEIIDASLDVSPTSIDTGSAGTFTITYDCLDAAGNAATQKIREVQVSTGENFRIISMTIEDLDGDGLAGCFKFVNLDPVTCDGATFFSSDGSGFLGAEGSERIPGIGADEDGSGNPIGIKFGEFQPVVDFVPRPANLPSLHASITTVPLGPISPGFLYTKLPFVPITFDPSSQAGSANPTVAEVPFGFVTQTDSDSALLTIPSLPFGGLFNFDNLFYLPPDPGTFSGTASVNNDDNGTTQTFNYTMTWNHFITAIEDPTQEFTEFNAFWRLEGVITAESASFDINGTPTVGKVSASQVGRDSTAIITADGGAVTVSVEAQDPDGNALTYDWSQNGVTAIGPADQPTFTFDPSNLSPGVQAMTVTVSDVVSEPLSAIGEIILRVETTSPVLSSSADFDSDGILDADEGFADDDGDGIANYQDATDGSVNPGRNRLDPANPGAGDIVSDSGILKLGRIASALGSSAFAISEEDIAQYGGSAATPVNNARDRLNDVRGVGPVAGGIRDFVVAGLSAGDTIQIVIPQNTPLPVEPQYRKYSPDTGWTLFSRVSGNAWASAPKVGGVCPDSSDPAYDAPTDISGTMMVAGDDCVRLTIVDGGANDADRVRNGVIHDPGTVSGNGSASSAENGGGCTLSEAGNRNLRGDWALLFAGLLGLFGFNKTRKRINK
ncbi:MAG: immunoglobulin-like domain-containing protein [Gammaproteobacteria bacterium]